MKSKVVAITFLVPSLLIGYSGIIYAEECYSVAGSVTMQNVTQSTQIGNIDLIVSNEQDVVFEDAGTLIGNITDPDTYPIILSHVAKFSKGNHFVTNGDQAYLIPTNIPCKFQAYEQITEIAGGTKFFKDVTDVYIQANGYVSYCPDDNMNEFELSGSVCFEETKP